MNLDLKSMHEFVEHLETIRFVELERKLTTTVTCYTLCVPVRVFFVASSLCIACEAQGHRAHCPHVIRTEMNRQGDGPIFTIVGHESKITCCKQRITSFIRDKGWMRPSDGERGTKTAKTLTRSLNDRRTTIWN
jgi:hypothetical protein